MDVDVGEDDVPQLMTLDQHLSDEISGKLRVGFGDVEERPAAVEQDSRKVPITILTGTFEMC